ncbi:MAG TPA: excisionase [Clostridium sp.]|nr:excisionase [Clostridium sp.]
MSKLYTCDEVAKRFSVQTRTVWDWIRVNKLIAIRIGREYRIKEEDLKAFEDERRTVSVTKE